jgi:hypothetical protein
MYPVFAEDIRCDLKTVRSATSGLAAGVRTAGVMDATVPNESRGAMRTRNDLIEAARANRFAFDHRVEGTGRHAPGERRERHASGRSVGQQDE